MTVRVAIAGPSDLMVFDQHEEVAGLEIGPRTEYFSVGLRGDGATFALVAADPLGRDVGHLLYKPSYRYSRYLFPLAARAVVLGNEHYVLLGLSVVNLASVALTAYVASFLSERIGWRAWIFLCNPAVIIGALWDTTEPLALLFLTIGIVSGSVIFALLTALTRPSFIVGLRSWRSIASALVAAVVMKTYWSAHFDESLFTGSHAFAAPFVGILQAPSVLGVLITTAAVVTALIGARRRDFAWVASGLLVMSLSPIVLDSPINALRAAGMLPVLWATGTGFTDALDLREIFLPPKRSAATVL